MHHYLFFVYFRITEFFEIVPSCDASLIYPSSPASLDTVILNIHENLWEQQQNKLAEYDISHLLPLKML